MIRSLLVVALLFGCSGNPGGPTMNNKMTAPDPPASPVVSTEILQREALVNTAKVKHILISWKDLADAFDGHQDQRGQNRTKPEAEAIVKTLVGQLAAGADFDQLMRDNSEDTGSAKSGTPYVVTPEAKLVIEFRQIGLRLKVGEIGVVQSDYGFHIVKRIE